MKNLPANTGDTGSIPGLGRSLEEEMTTSSSILAWKIPWTEEPGGLQSMGSQTVGHSWACMPCHPSWYRPGVPNLWDLMFDDLGCSWCNTNRLKVHNKCNGLQSSWNHPHYLSWKNCLPQNWSPLTKRLRTTGLDNLLVPWVEGIDCEWGWQPFLRVKFPDYREWPLRSLFRLVETLFWFSETDKHKFVHGGVGFCRLFSYMINTYSVPCPWLHGTQNCDTVKELCWTC